MSTQQRTVTVPIMLHIDKTAAVMALHVDAMTKELSDIEAARLKQRHAAEHALRPNVQSIATCLEFIGLAFVKAVTEASQRVQGLAEDDET